MSQQIPELPVIDGVQVRPAFGLVGYCVGNDGSVWTCRVKGGAVLVPDRFMGGWVRVKQHTTKRGYRFVNVTTGGKQRRMMVHRLVLEAFVAPCPPGREACHYPNRDPSDNRLENLRWDTHTENMRDKTRDAPPTDTKACRRCGEVLPRSMFYRDTRSGDGLKTECKACHVRTARQTRDPEKKRAANREFMRRARRGK